MPGENKKSGGTASAEKACALALGGLGGGFLHGGEVEFKRLRL